MSTQTKRQSTSMLIALALSMALQMTGFVMILPLFARRFESFGAGVDALGMSAMAYALSSTVAAPIIGMVADRLGRRPIILFSLAAYILAFSGYLFATSTGLIILLRGLAGLFTAGLIPAIISSVGDLASEERRAQWIGVVNGGASAGWIIGPVLGGLLYDRFGYAVPFAVSIAMAVAALIVAVLFIPETHRPAVHFSNRSVRPKRFRTWAVAPTFLILMFISFGVIFAWAFIDPQFMFYVYDELHWTSYRLGLIMSWFGGACMFGEFALSRLSDRFGRKPVLVLGLVLFSAQFVGLAIFRNATWIVLSFILAGLGNAIFDPALSAYILDITPPEHKASVIGLKCTVGSLGNMLGPALVVLVAPLVSPQLVFLISAALVFVLALTSGLALRTPLMSGVGLFRSQSVVAQNK